MAGLAKRRRAGVAALGDDERRRQRQEEAVLILRKIKGLVRWVVAEVGAGRSPSVALHRYQNYCASASASASPSPSPCVCSYDTPIGTAVLSLLHRDYHASRLNVLLRVLLVVQQLLQENKHCSKRDIYYMYPSIFIEQAVVDRAINDICILFKCSRHNLNVVPVVKGLLMGWIRFVEGEKKVYCIANVNACRLSPSQLALRQSKMLLVLLTTYLLLRRRLCFSVWPMISSARGITALLLQEEATQIFRQEVDSDPHGFDILATYKFGSMQLAYDANLLRVPEIRWLGVFTSDFHDYCLPDCCILHLSPEDRRKLEGILARCYLHREAPEWRLELEAMLQKGVKFEIEALSASSISFLSEEYIPQKIKLGRHI